MYMAQSFCHAVIAGFVTDRAMKSWQVRDPLLRQRFRLAVILIAVVSFPLYQLAAPGRSSPQFRLAALFDANRWLVLEIGGIFPAGLLFLALMAATAFIFLFQEMMPVIGHTLASRGSDRQGDVREPNAFLVRAAAALSLAPPRVCVVDDEDPLLFSTTGRDACITISTGLERQLSSAQLRAAVAHELAHIARNRRPFLIAVFFLRILMFFNPVVLVKFRGVVRDEEKICDEMAVSLTGDREALASALEHFLQPPAEKPALEHQSLQTFTSNLEQQSHWEHLQNRIARLRQPPAPAEGGTAALAVSVAVVLVLNYFIV